MCSGVFDIGTPFLGGVLFSLDLHRSGPPCHRYTPSMVGFHSHSYCERWHGGSGLKLREAEIIKCTYFLSYLDAKYKICFNILGFLSLRRIFNFQSFYVYLCWQQYIHDIGCILSLTNRVCCILIRVQSVTLECLYLVDYFQTIMFLSLKKQYVKWQ